jgi:pimeloyl-ACP methyl ester carboxylesterase
VLFNTVEAVGEALPENFKFEEPTLFLAGQHSGYILAQDHLSILHQFPAAQIETIAKAGHWLHAENPTDFFKKTMRFLEA